MPRGGTTGVHVLPNGYDERLFDPERKLPEPALFADIPRPRIIVTGHVSERIDWDGVEAAIKARPNWTWVFVGPADRDMPGKIEKLSVQTADLGNGGVRPRIIWRDAIPLEGVPALIAHCDACAVPYRLNAFTRASSPLKAVEYLAMGAAVMSTRVPSLGGYGKTIQWIEERDGSSYARALDEILSERNDAARIQARRDAVRNESWAKKKNQFRNLVLNAES
jgi:UDP-galactopyranose mutase